MVQLIIDYLNQIDKNRKMFSREIEEILKIGKPLFDVGINNWALTKSEAINVIEQLASLQVPILGGDVYQIINGTMQSNYDNWYCEPLPGETKSNFVERSKNKAKDFIMTYKSKDSYNTFFLLVPDA